MKQLWQEKKLLGAVLFLSIIVILGFCLKEQALATDFTQKNLPPSLAHPFGTDFMGRDMFVRTLAGLSLSIMLGLLTAFISAVIALLLGSAAALLGKWIDGLISWLIDLMLGIPHILLLMLIAFALGKGFWSVVIGIALTHWMALSRLIRAEVLALKNSPYVQIAEKLGAGKWQIFQKHLLPHLAPQFVVGFVLLFPHAILHEASLTFLGFGLAPEAAAIGIIFSESMGHLASGDWWLAVFPGFLLVFTVMLFDYIGRRLKKWNDISAVE